MARIESVVAAALACGSGDSDNDDGMLATIAGRWADVAEPDRSVGVARDVILLHVATMTNLVAALAWTIVRVLLDERATTEARAGDRAAIDRCSLEAIRLAQRSIMMRTALRDVELDDGETVRNVARGTIIATMLPVTNLAEPPEHVTTFGHGSHRCPAKRFSMSAIAVSIVRLFEALRPHAAVRLGARRAGVPDRWAWGVRPRRARSHTTLGAEREISPGRRRRELRERDPWRPPDRHRVSRWSGRS